MKIKTTIILGVILWLAVGVVLFVQDRIETAECDSKGGVVLSGHCVDRGSIL